MIIYSGHSAGQADHLPDGDKYYWNESISIQSGSQLQKCLRSGTSYGPVMVTDNYWPEVTRTFTATGLSRSQIDTIIAGATVPFACFTLTTVLGYTYTGRFRSFSAQTNSSASETSAFYSATLVLTDLTAEDSGTTRATTVLSDPVS